VNTTLTQHVGRTEIQLTTPGSGALARVRSDVEDIVGGRLKSVDDDGRLGGVGRPVVGRVASVVVEQLVQDDLAVAVLAGRLVPLQADARRTHANCGEIERRAGRNCATNVFTLDATSTVSR